MSQNCSLSFEFIRSGSLGSAELAQYLGNSPQSAPPHLRPSVDLGLLDEPAVERRRSLMDFLACSAPTTASSRTIGQVDDGVDVGPSSQQTQGAFQLLPDQVKHFVAGCGDGKGEEWPKSDLSLASFYANLEQDNTREKILGPSRRFLDGGIAIVPLYAAYTVHSYMGNFVPVHSSTFVKLLMKRFNIGGRGNQENNDGQNISTEKRLALGDKHKDFTDENMDELMNIIAPSRNNAHMFDFLMKSRETGNRIRFIKGIFYVDGFLLCEHAVSLLWSLDESSQAAPEMVTNKLLFLLVFFFF